MKTYRTYQAIVTKYLPATNTRGSRIKASASAGSKTIGYDDSLNTDGAHAVAAQALAEKFGWEGTWYGGGMPDGKGNVFVCVPLGDVAAFVVGKMRG